MDISTKPPDPFSKEPLSDKQKMLNYNRFLPIYEALKGRVFNTDPKSKGETDGE
jgi:hypothetical protein